MNKFTDPSRHHKGDIRADGKFFWGLRASCKNGEYWVSREKFLLLRQKEAESKAHLTPEAKARNLEAVQRYQRKKKAAAKWKLNYVRPPRIPKTINLWAWRTTPTSTCINPQNKNPSFRTGSWVPGFGVQPTVLPQQVVGSGYGVRGASAVSR
jgi:hypothetical protein